MMMAEPGLTKPAAGVIETRPATAPVAAPSRVGLPPVAHSVNIQVRAAAAAAVLVVTNATAAKPSAASALPALKPNQPTHRMPAPVTAMGRLWGSMAVLGKPCLGPISMAATRAAMPELMCTTVPPAKSSAPIAPSHPPPHTQWATGA